MDYSKEISDFMRGLNILSREKNFIITQAKYGPSKRIRIPLRLDEKLSCLVAAIIGDGHIRSDKTCMQLDGYDKSLITNFQEISKILFDREFNVTTRKENEKDRYCLRIHSLAVYKLINSFFGVPAGKKSNIVSVPHQIREANNSIKSAFLIGILVTEGGRRRRGFGLSTASRKLWRDLENLLREIGVEVKIDKWIYKKYNKMYYGLSFKKIELQKIINNCNDRKIRELLIDCKNFQEDYVC